MSHGREEYTKPGGKSKDVDFIVLEMAEKRSFARATLKILGLYEIGIKSEDEIEDFKK